MPLPSLMDVPHDLLPVNALLAEGLVQAERRIAEHLDSDLPPVRALCRHVESYRGKMVRPTLTLLSALAAAARPLSPPDGIAREDGRAAAEEGVLGSSLAASLDAPPPHSAARPLRNSATSFPSPLITVAAVCEMVHLATLVHDDVLDDADTRRRTVTVNRLRGNEAAVILGDYLFSSAYHLCSGLGGAAGQQASLLIASVGRTLCAGELLQLHHRDDLSLDEPTYYEIIERKTASLIAAACQLGAMYAPEIGGAGLGGQPAVPSQAESSPSLHGNSPSHSAAPPPRHSAASLPCAALSRFGLKLGVAFQIQDDLLDLTGDPATVGKSLGKDLEKGKLTLPFIHHLAAAAPAQRGRTLTLLRTPPDHATPADLTHTLLQGLNSTGSIEHARAAAAGLVTEAKACLSSLPDTPARSALLAMADAAVTRVN